MDDFEQQIQKIVGEYRGTIDKKFSMLAKEWNKRLIESSSNPEELQKTVEKICSDIKKNDKFKIPWNMMEVEESIKSVRKLFDH